MVLCKNQPPTISTDSFLNGKLKIYQSKDAFKSGSDAVFLSAFPNIKSGTVLDVGCGTGVISLCLANRFPLLRIEGVDIQKDLISLASQNAEENNLGSQCTFSWGDIINSSYEKQSFDHVVTNPPYFNFSSPSPNPKIALAKNQKTSLETWIKACANHLKPRGFIYSIYPTERIDNMIHALVGFGGINLFPLWSKANDISKRTLISAQKGVFKPCKLHPGMILHNSDGTYTDQAEGVLRSGHLISV